MKHSQMLLLLPFGILLPSIAILVNCSLSQGFVPEDFKKAVVTSLIKTVKGLAVSQMIDHINSNGLDKKNPTRLVTQLKQVAVHKESGPPFLSKEALTLVLLDQSAAFDTIDHSTLLSWLQTWFGNSGTVHLTHKHATLAFERLKNCLDDVRKWLSVNKLKLNPEKTEFILFGSKNVCTKLGKFFPVNILGTLLSPAEAIRNLGVWFDSDFSFSCHVRNICLFCSYQGFKATQRVSYT